MTAVYFDESGSQKPHDVFVLAGCVSTAERWVQFKKAWRERLSRDGITYFHTSDWARHRPPYDRLTENNHKALGRDLCRLIEGDNVLQCVMEVIPAQFYRQVFIKELHQDALRAYQDPYFFCFLSCLKQISLARQKGKVPDERVQCFFERRDRDRDRHLMREYERVRHEFFRGEFGVIASGAKRDPEAIPCQAADLIAYQSIKYMRAKLGRATDPPTIALYKLTDKGKLSGGSFSQPQVWKPFLEEAKAHQRQIEASHER
jgi:Protein of unknown function (DUF3800)